MLSHFTETEKRGWPHLKVDKIYISTYQTTPEMPEISIKSRQQLKIFHSTAEDSLLLHIKYRPCQTIVAIGEQMIERFRK